jgi:prefoldin subunit 5
VKFRRVFFEEIIDERVKLLREEEKKHEDSIEEWEEKRENCEKEKNLIENITTKITEPSKRTDSSELDPDNWMKMVDFYRTRMDALNLEMRQMNAEISILRNKMEKVQSELDLLDGNE